MKFVLPLTVIAAAVIVPYLGAAVTYRAFMRRVRRHPETPVAELSTDDLIGEDRRVWALPIGALILRPTSLTIGVLWLLIVIVVSLL